MRRDFPSSASEPRIMSPNDLRYQMPRSDPQNPAYLTFTSTLDRSAVSPSTRCGTGTRSLTSPVDVAQSSRDLSNVSAHIVSVISRSRSDEQPNQPLAASGRHLAASKRRRSGAPSHGDRQ